MCRILRTSHVVALLCLTVTNALSAQTATWTQASPAQSPPPRALHAAAFDSDRAELVVFGGFSGPTLGDTWIWNGLTWQQQFPAVSPPLRDLHAIAYDATRRDIVLFGGYQFGTSLGDTWVWQSGSWSQRVPTTAPPARFSHALAFDSTRHELVLFGGSSAVTPTDPSYDDTWVWDGSTWAQRSPAQRPRPRNGHSLAFDAARQQVVLFGGCDPTCGPGTFITDTWVWDGANWQQKLPTTVPPARTGQQMVYDASQQVIVMFGGRSPSGTALNDTWIWNGSDWGLLTPAVAPSPRFFPTLTYDSARHVSVLFGGGNGGPNLLGDTWTLQLGATNQPPRARFTMCSAGSCVNDGGSLSVTVPLNKLAIVNFSAANSADSDGLIVAYRWSIAGVGERFSSSFAEQIGAGQRQVTLTVTDDDGASASATASLSVNELGPPHPPGPPPPPTVVNGFDYPVSNLYRPTRIATDADGWFATNSFGIESTSPPCRLRFHPGDDWNRNDKQDAGEAVKAVATGKVLAIRELKNAEGTALGQGIALSHLLPDGSTVYSVYVHVNVNKDVFVTKPVGRGEPIATIADLKTFGPHLHFEMRTAFKTSDWYPEDDGCGYYDSLETILRLGFIDPVAFIDARRSLP